MMPDTWFEQNDIDPMAQADQSSRRLKENAVRTTAPKVYNNKGNMEPCLGAWISRVHGRSVLCMPAFESWMPSNLNLK